NADDMVEMCEAEGDRIIERGRTQDPRVRVGIQYGVAKRDDKGALAFDYPAYSVDGDEAKIAAWDLESIKARRYPGISRVSYRAPHHRTFAPVIDVSTPVAYLVPSSLASRLRGHGIEFEAVTDSRTYEVDSYRIEQL